MSLLNLNSPAGQSPRGKKSLKMWMGAGLVVAVLGIGSTFAANINVNSGEDAEFGQGLTGTVYCGAGEQSVVITPLSGYVNASSAQRQIAPAQAAVAAVTYTYRFATSVNTSNSSDFISSNQATKVVNGRTGVWLTDTGSSGQIASNQDEKTFSSSNRSNYVFSQNATTKNGTRGFYKVNNSTSESIVITPAVAARSAQMETYTVPGAFKVSGIIVSKLPEECEDKNFVLSAYGSTGDALKLVDDGEGTVREVAALWTGNAGMIKLSSNRACYQQNPNLDGVQSSTSLTVSFESAVSQLLNADSMAKIIIETQEDALSSDCNNQEPEEDEEDDD
jgi:hypothetical protein